MVASTEIKEVAMSTIKGKNVNHPNYTENLNAEKYAIIREAMLHVLPADGSMSCEDLETGVQAYVAEKQVPKEMFPKPGSIRWYCKAVQLDLEARNEIERVPRQSPLQLRKVNASSKSDTEREE
jgi:hypothetical protein